jgi:hypothetical protein
MKLGLDIHGVLDSNPKFFSDLSHAVINAGGQVHIITGPAFDKVKFYLEENKIAYTNFFSIVDNAGKEVEYDSDGNPWLPTEKWDRAKAKYCKDNDIDLHIDDSSEYGKYFKTPYAFFKGKK